MWHLLLFAAFQLIASGYAWRSGGAPERVVGVAMLVAWGASAGIGQDVMLVDGIPAMTLVADLGLLAVLVWVMLRADRLWPVAMLAMHLLTGMAHGTQVLGLGIPRDVYVALSVGWSFPMTWLLIIATWRYQRRRKAGTAGPDWTPWPRPDPARPYEI